MQFLLAWIGFGDDRTRGEFLSTKDWDTGVSAYSYYKPTLLP